jgi:hypothetical protein
MIVDTGYPYLGFCGSNQYTQDNLLNLLFTNIPSILAQKSEFLKALPIAVSRYKLHRQTKLAVNEQDYNKLVWCFGFLAFINIFSCHTSN